MKKVRVILRNRKSTMTRFAPTPLFFSWLDKPILGVFYVALLACSSNDSGHSGSKAKKSSPSKAEKEDTKQSSNDHPPPSKGATTQSAPGDPTGNGDSTANNKPKPNKFKKGGRPPRALIANDVPLYNKAQGDPIDGNFTLEQAFEGDPKLADKKNGKLIAKFETSLGNFTCELYEEQSPFTVANFVGLARGTRPFLDKKTDTWKKGKFYDGVIFHRVIKGFMLQTGDPTGSGTGSPGYFVVDEFSDKLKHDSPGILSMANRNPIDPVTKKLRIDKETGQSIGNTGSSQFFITVAPTKHLNNRHSIFGKCDPKVPIKISKVKVQNLPMQGIDHRPFEKVSIKTIHIERSKK